MAIDFETWLDNLSVMKLKALKKLEKYPPEKRNRVDFFKLQIECSLLNEILRVRNSQKKK